jgi:hypothetical protein
MGKIRREWRPKTVNVIRLAAPGISLCQNMLHDNLRSLVGILNLSKMPSRNIRYRASGNKRSKLRLKAVRDAGGKVTCESTMTHSFSLPPETKKGITEA